MESHWGRHCHQEPRPGKAPVRNHSTGRISRIFQHNLLLLPPAAVAGDQTPFGIAGEISQQLFHGCAAVSDNSASRSCHSLSIFSYKFIPPPSVQKCLFPSAISGMIMTFLNGITCGGSSQHPMRNPALSVRKTSGKGWISLPALPSTGWTLMGSSASTQGAALHCQQLIPKQILFKC